MRIITTGLAALFLSAGFVSCSGSTVEEDMKEYCECVNQDKKVDKLTRCKRLAKKMQKKYEYDPEAAEYIKNHIGDCASN